MTRYSIFRSVGAQYTLLGQNLLRSTRDWGIYGDNCRETERQLCFLGYSRYIVWKGDYVI